MAFRTNGGQRIDDLDAAIAEWRAAGRSPSTYCSKADHEAWEDDLGELTLTTADGTEVRRHANIKTSTYRSGNPRISHNRVLVGNPAKYAAWLKKNAEEKKAGVPLADQGWMAQWTYYPDKDHDDQASRYEPTSAA